MGRRNKFYVHSALCSKFKLKWVTELNVKPNIIKFLEYDRKNFDCECCKRFLYPIAKIIIHF